MSVRAARRRSDALIVGGNVHDRLRRRQELKAEGFRVTIERSLARGLQQLRRHPFAICELDVSSSKTPRRWRREFQAVSGQLGAELRDRTREHAS